jgi:hypothetical protein
MTTPDETEAAAPRAETKVRYFRIRNRLKAKTAGAGPQDGPPRLAGGALEKAMKEMETGRRGLSRLGVADPDRPHGRS